ncbi:MAG: AI-2E family transporter [Campylobacter sp.]|nr:AI-2E family transporter [Campylobacter sp.]
MKNLSFLISFACIVIILAGLKAAAGIVVPFLLAMFLAIIVSPLLEFCEKIKIPRLISFVLTSVIFFWLMSLLGKIVFNTLSDFTTQLPELHDKFQNLSVQWIDKLNSFDFINIDKELLDFNPMSDIVANLRSLLKETSSFLSMMFFIFLLVAFMLFETTSLKHKMVYLETNSPNAKNFVDTFVYNLKKYLLIKTIASAFTGLFIGIGLYVVGVPYAPLWGIVAYILNYIPTIGSIVAAIPALFVTLSLGDMSMSAWTLGIYLFVNTMIGNIIEPRFMGEGLGISTILVLASLLLWGFIFGIGGLFLAIPLTMTIQIALSSNPKTKDIALMLSNKLNLK